MTTQTEIGNLALSACGARSSIASFDEDSPEARELSKWYDTTRRQIIRMARWGCTRTYANLALLKAAAGTPENPTPSLQWTPAQPPPPWLYEYAYPSEALLANFIVPQIVENTPTAVPIFSGGVGYNVASNAIAVKSIVTTDVIDGTRTKCICTNQPQAILCYNADVTEPDQWDEGLSQAIIYGLGAAVCFQLTGNAKQQAVLFSLANDVVMQARQMSANENLSTQDVIPDFIRARGVSGYFENSVPWLDPVAVLFPGVV